MGLFNTDQIVRLAKVKYVHILSTNFSHPETRRKARASLDQISSYIFLCVGTADLIYFILYKIETERYGNHKLSCKTHRCFDLSFKFHPTNPLNPEKRETPITRHWSPGCPTVSTRFVLSNEKCKTNTRKEQTTTSLIRAMSSSHQSIRIFLDLVPYLVHLFPIPVYCWLELRRISSKKYIIKG